MLGATFLSTLPARGATYDLIAIEDLAPKFLSTLPARGATDAMVTGDARVRISIHAPREGSDFFSAR